MITMTNIYSFMSGLILDTKGMAMSWLDVLKRTYLSRGVESKHQLLQRECEMYGAGVIVRTLSISSIS